MDETNVKLRFQDSFRFIPSSIEKLASYLQNEDKRITLNHSKNLNAFNLLTTKRCLLLRVY